MDTNGAPGSSHSSSSSSAFLPPVPPPPAPAAPVRSEMVTAAKQFLAHPRVKHTPLGEQRDFLRGKGLTEAEIDMAMEEQQKQEQQSTTGQLLSSMNQQMPHFAEGMDEQSKRQSGGGNLVLDMARSALVLGTAGYMVYRFVRSWLLPQLLNVPDPAEERMQRLEAQVDRLADSSRAVAETMAQTLGTVTEQNEQVSRTLLLIQSSQARQQQRVGGQQDNQLLDNKVLAEIGIVKSLLLAQNQFPPVPQGATMPPIGRVNGGNSEGTTGGSMKLPNWQLADGQNGNGKEAEQNGETDGDGGGRRSANGSEV